MSSVLQSRAVVAAKPGLWEAAQAVARKQAENANTRSGHLVYADFLDVPRQKLINIAACRDAESWLARMSENPCSREYMSLVELVSLEVDGEPTETAAPGRGRLW